MGEDHEPEIFPGYNICYHTGTVFQISALFVEGFNIANMNLLTPVLL